MKKTKKVHVLHFEMGCVEKFKSDGTKSKTLVSQETSFWNFEEFNSKKSLGGLGIQFSVMAENET